MSASQAYSAFNTLALIGWIILVLGVLANKPLLRDRIAGVWIPVFMSASYLVLMLLFLGSAEGGFGSLDAVMQMFTNSWVVVAGWIHYLAFDLFIGSYIARKMMALGKYKWALIFILPLTFILGPIGFLCYQLFSKIAERRAQVQVHGESV
jgi:hypothetical protein